jgi:hypothetical protein
MLKLGNFPRMGPTSVKIACFEGVVHVVHMTAGSAFLDSAIHDRKLANIQVAEWDLVSNGWWACTLLSTHWFESQSVLLPGRAMCALACRNYFVAPPAFGISSLSTS